MTFETPFGPVRAERHGPNDAPTALVLPGVDYTPARPLLHFTRKLLVRRGFAVLELWWEFSRQGDPHQWVAAHVDAVPGPLALVVGKSLGTFAAARMADVPAVWLTPLLQFDPVASALADARAPMLLVCGGADEATRAEVLERLSAEKLVIPGADHSLELDDPLASLDALRQVVERIDEFVGRL